ncbi:hypothetical protein [Pseudomonas sp. dw_612]|uniref:hypothetical protein n=1 Tax=Pseudomonas sp. dw_612 TaxID=2720080 RepID=UPI001BD40374|nr:hypothetical protein [Pseudomonas sp. dw_612]
MLKSIIPLILAAAVCGAQADVQVLVMPIPEQLQPLKPIEVAESDLEKRKRLDRIDSVVQRFKLNKDEKFIYTSEKSPSMFLGHLSVVYKVYPEETQLKVIKFNMRNGEAYLFSVNSEDIQPYTHFITSSLDTRVVSDVLRPGASAAKSKEHYKDWYDTYQSSRAKLARKIVASNTCETVTSVDFYSLNGGQFTAFCGNGMEFSQTQAEIESEQPIDPTIKKWVVKRPQ